MIGTTLGHYRIVERIGAGGMGEVYRARDERLDRDVAIKVLPEAVVGDPQRMRRFEREAKALAALNHPNIATVYGLESAPSDADSDADSDAGQPFLVMELLEGESLREVISSGRLTAAKSVEYARAIADGLAAAHDRGIIHRDLKPENVFLTKDGRIKILDFGLAKLRQPELEAGTETPTVSMETAEGAVMGTVPYMAPEQVRGERADHRSDLFALGCVLYEMLAGRRPFGGGTSAEISAAILKEDPAPLSSAVPGISPSLAAVVARCLEKRQEDRFDSAHDLSLTLGALDTSASIPLPTQQASFVYRRWPHLLAVAIAAVIALLVILPPEALFEGRVEDPDAQPAEAAPPRIVVLPFENLGSPEDEYFADGITEELISRLAAVSGLRVISRTSAMYYKGKNVPLKQIGDELDVSYVLEGTIRWDRSEGEHGRVRITPQLIRVADDSHVWSERYDRVLEDLFVTQSEIARSVIEKLNVILGTDGVRGIFARPTENLDAYDLYLRGRRDSGSLSSSRERAEFLKNAVELDPRFALAWAELSVAETYTATYLDSSQVRKEAALSAARTALEIDPLLPEAHYARAWYDLWIPVDLGAAREQVELGLDLAPNNSRLLLLRARVTRRNPDLWPEALADLQRAEALDPMSSRAATMLGWHLLFMRRLDEAEEAIRRALSIDRDYQFAIRCQIMLQLARGDLVGAREFLAEATETADRAELFAYLAVLDDLYWVLDESAQRDLLRQDPDVFGGDTCDRALAFAHISHSLGDRSSAVDWAKEAREILAVRLRDDPDSSGLHSLMGVALAYLGLREDAIESGLEGVRLYESRRDGAYPYNRMCLVRILCLFAELDAAMEQLPFLFEEPFYLTPNWARIDPLFRPLRDDPRFQALLEKYDTQSN